MRHPGFSEDEKLIWVHFQAGDEKAFAYLFNAYFEKLYRFGLGVHPDPSLVKDCTQELFVRIWHTKENLGQPLSIYRYLAESLKRSIIKEIARKKYKQQAELADDYHFEVVCSHEFQLIDLQVSEDRLKQLQRALNKLSKRQRDAIHLKYYGKLSYEEIAEIMDLQVRSVYNLISKALEVLYQEMHYAENYQSVPLLLLLSVLHYSSLS